MAENLKVSLDLRDIDENETVLAELREKSGASQVPYLIDSEKNVSMLESNDIIEYLRTNYSNSASDSSSTAKPRVHVGGSTCLSCEG
jgi:glutathione S-transferase